MGKLLRTDRLVGVNSDLRARFERAVSRMSFDVQVQAQGGLRTDETAQAKLYAAGNSKAKTLADTAHGRGGAIDGAPIRNGSPILKGPKEDPTTAALWAEYGRQLKAEGLVWGGDWGWDFFHAELPLWRQLPMPVILATPVIIGLIILFLVYHWR